MIWPCEAVFAPRCDFSEKGGEFPWGVEKATFAKKSQKWAGSKSKQEKGKGLRRFPFPYHNCRQRRQNKGFLGMGGGTEKGVKTGLGSGFRGRGLKMANNYADVARNVESGADSKIAFKKIHISRDGVLNLSGKREFRICMRNSLALN